MDFRFHGRGRLKNRRRDEGTGSDEESEESETTLSGRVNEMSRLIESMKTHMDNIDSRLTRLEQQIQYLKLRPAK